MQRSEAVAILRDFITVEPDEAEPIDLALRILADETRVWSIDDATTLWDFVMGCRECEANVSVPNTVSDAIDLAELITRRECERLDFRPTA